MMKRRWLLIGVLLGLIGCGGVDAPPTITVVPRLTSTAIATAFNSAGLEVGETRPMTPVDYDKIKNLTGVVDGTRFFLPSLCADCGGRIFVFDNAADYEKARKYYVGLGNTMLYSWVYEKPDDLALVQINGDLPAEQAAKYQQAFASVGSSQVASLAQERATPAPTRTPAPTTKPTPRLRPTPTTIPRGLGSRDTLQTLFEGKPFLFTFTEKDESGTIGVNGVLSPPLKGIEIRLSGTSIVEEAQIRFQPKAGGLGGEIIPTYMAGFLRAVVPSISDPKAWVMEHLTNALKNKTDTSIEGDVIISIIAAPEADYLLLSVLPQ